MRSTINLNTLVPSKS
jgi:sphingomyelin phosphodiesterase